MSTIGAGPPPLDPADIGEEQDTVSAQFDFANADVELLARRGPSERGVVFRVHKRTLSALSQVFNDMFDTMPPHPTCSPTLPSATDACEEGNVNGGTEALPRIPLEESASTIERILPYFYSRDAQVPLPDLEALSFNELMELLETADKYGAVLVQKILEERLNNIWKNPESIAKATNVSKFSRNKPKPFPRSDAFRLYAYACRVNHLSLKKAALQATWGENEQAILKFDPDEMRRMAPSDVHTLWKHHYDCELRAIQAFTAARELLLAQLFEPLYLQPIAGPHISATCKTETCALWNASVVDVIREMPKTWKEKETRQRVMWNLGDKDFQIACRTCKRAVEGRKYNMVRSLDASLEDE